MAATRGLVIPDLQVGPGRSLKHIEWIGAYCADKEFPLIVQIGDWADFPSLSSYDKNKAASENRRLSKDWDAFRRSADLLMAPIEKKRGYQPRLVFTAGNHEERVFRYMNDNAQIDTLPNPLEYLASRGWETHKFLCPVRIHDVLFAHYFPRSMTGRVTAGGLRYGSTSAMAMIRANMDSCVAGHRPGFEPAIFTTNDRTVVGVIAGSCYTHKEEWAGPGGDNYWRGVVALNQLRNGRFDPCPVSLDWLRERYGRRRSLQRRCATSSAPRKTH